MTEFKFKSSDFDEATTITLRSLGCVDLGRTIASIANAKLKEWLDKAPTIYAQWEYGDARFDSYLTKDNSPCKSAKLVNICEIEGEK